MAASLIFSSGGVDYVALEFLGHVNALGTVWVAVLRNHDLEVGPIQPLVVLAPDVVTSSY
jgi:hypothetical protein